MKKGRVIILMFFLFVCIGLRAQWNFGVKAGLGYTTQRMDWDPNNKFGLLAGGVATYCLNDHLDLQGELYYANRGYKTDVYLDLSTGKPSDWYFTYHYLCLPVTLKYFPTGKGVYVAAGPQIAYLAGHNNDIDGWPANEPREAIGWQEYNRIDFGVCASIGFITNSGLFVDLRYNFGLTDVVKNGKTKNRGLEFSLGYMF